MKMNDSDIKIKRGRGRPRKLYDTLDKIVRGRGRPKGSSNKIKVDSIDVIDDGMAGIEGGIGTMVGGGVGSCSDTTTPHNKNLNNDISNNHELSSNIDTSENINNKSNDSIIYNNIDISNIDPNLIIEARRALALSSLQDYACMIDIPDAPIVGDDDEDSFSTIRLDSLAAHHLLMCNEMQNLVTKTHKERTYDNIMFFEPPGSAKSTYVDVIFGSWYLAKFKRRQVILGSYGDEPALNQARKTKALVSSKDYQNLFPDIKLSKDRTAVDNWALSNGSSFLSRSLFGEITGRRSDLGILDDPVKGAEDADSETMQVKTWKAYLNNFATRLKPGAPMILIMTRWNENDLAGQILPDGWDGESGDFLGKDKRRWRVICLPAICDRHDDPLGRKIGESLWPEWFGSATGDPMDHWEPFRSEPRTWASLYQQKPTAGDGIYFLRESFKRYNKSDLPNNLRYYGTSDYAVTENKGDFTALRIWGIDDSVEPPNIYRVAGWSGKTKSDKWITEQCNLIEKYRPLKWFGEAGAIQKAIEPSLIEQMRKRRLICNMIWMPSSVSKEIRTRPAQSLVQEGRIFVEDNVEGDSFINECIKFPAGKHDDEVDNLALIGRAIDQISIKRIKPKITKIPPTSTPFNRKRA